jgi:acyl carrier protein
MDEAIREALNEQGRLATAVADLGEHDDLYRAGLTSHASVNLMLALEERFGIEFPDRLLRRATFGSIAAIRGALEELVGTPSKGV